MMRRILPLLLMATTLASAAPASVRSLAFQGDQGGSRISFSVDREVLSRSYLDASGHFVVELRDAKGQWSGEVRPLAANPFFTDLRIEQRQGAGAPTTAFLFSLRPGRSGIDVRARSWDGKNLSFVLSEPTKAPFQIGIQPSATVERPALPERPVLAVPTQIPPAVQDIRVTSSGAMESVELLFDRDAPEAELVASQEGRKFEVRLGAAKFAATAASPKGDGLLVQKIGSERRNGGAILSIQLKESARGAVLSRERTRLVLRVAKPSKSEGIWSWSAAAKQTRQFGVPEVPQDELASISSLQAKGLPAKGSATFTPATAKQTTAPVATAEPAAAEQSGGAVREAEKLEAEKRRSAEFALKQEQAERARDSEEAQKNRVRYNTYGLRDPFLPLEEGDVQGGLNIDQMKVVGIIFSATRPMAVLEHVSESGISVALKEGDAIQNGRVLKIYRDRVVFELTEYGVSREFALKLQTPKGDKS